MVTKDYVMNFDRFAGNSKVYESYETETSYDIEDEDGIYEGEDDNFEFESLVEEIECIREDLMNSYINESYNDEDGSMSIIANMIYENAYNVPFLESMEAILEAEEQKEAAKETPKKGKMGFFKKAKLAARSLVGKVGQAISYLKKKVKLKKRLAQFKYNRAIKNEKMGKNRPDQIAKLTKQRDEKLKEIDDAYQAEFDKAKRKSTSFSRTKTAAKAKGNW